ncbi:PAS domain S-box protein [Sneathiella glossodoripedis]|uniref:PAS domain S-box protein n=1 Tax=Sneathiella glossodoripedis TaxID=418853 RepID=UPI000471BA47|nr:PAS domain S-box protein [Sneathiella glossodoripedis]
MTVKINKIGARPDANKSLARLLLGQFVGFWSSAQRRKLLVSVVVLQTCATLLILIALISGQQGFLKDSVKSQAENLGRSLEVLLEQTRSGISQGLLEKFLVAQATLPGVQGIAFYNNLGNLEFSTTSTQNRSIKLIIEAKKDVGFDGAVFVEESLNGFDVLVPVLVADKLYGWVRMQVARDDNVALLLQELSIGASLILLSLLFAVALVYVSTRQLQNSLAHMIDVATRFRSGERGLRIELAENDELAPLGVKFNELADTVNNREAELFDQREHLEEVVLERTRDLVKEVRERQIAEDQVNMIVQSAMEGIILAGSNGEILNFNPAAAQIFGYSQKEVMGQNLANLIPMEFDDGKPTSFIEYMNKVELGHDGTRGAEVISRRSDGEKFVMELAISHFKEQNQNFFTIIVRDISERKEAEKRLRETLSTLQLTQAELVQSEKLASLGSLVAGVAHEINTPIGVGVTAASHLHEKVQKLQVAVENGTLKKSDFLSFLNTAERSTKITETNLMRASDLIKSFKQVAVDQSSEASRTFALVDYIEEVLLSLQPQLKKYKHQVKVTGDRDIIVESLPGPIAQIITNLVMNSIIHAFPDQEVGEITINVKRRGEMLDVTYRDNGCGMDEQTVSKIFDPFFTTRRGAGGSGLGLHILFNQVTQSLGGTIKCNSVVGEGTEFHFSFPYTRGK